MMFKRLLKRLLLALLDEELRKVDREIAALRSEDADHWAAIARIREALGSVKAGVSLSRKGAWACLGYSQGQRDFVKFYDFGNTNLGGLRQMIEGYRKAGLAVLVDSPFPVKEKI